MATRSLCILNRVRIQHQAFKTGGDPSGLHMRYRAK